MTDTNSLSRAFAFGLVLVCCLWTADPVISSPIVYDVSLAERDHHEMHVEVTFPDLPASPLEVRMSRTSPGRYALHEFAKNVYAVSAVNGLGEALAIERPDLHQWTITGHGGKVVFSYTLFGDLSDGTYAAIDSSHAHLNIPASFVWARGLEDRPVELRIDVPDGWKVGTQLVAIDETTFSAPNLAAFVDSPVEVSASESFEWDLGDGDGKQTIQLVLHHIGGEAEAQALADLTRLVVDEQIALFGEPPSFDDGRYTFLVDALPWSNGDGMEHRNSTIVTTGGTVDERIEDLAGTISHEFFHAWNVERLRPSSLEPFDLESANTSRELWFAEGFTSYYGRLVLARTGLLDLESLANAMTTWVDRVLNSPGTQRQSPIEMSSRAPFVDAASANEPTNRTNNFVSYYTYGAALALGLDLRLRSTFEGVTLDDFMRAAWQRYGVPEITYGNEDLRVLLGDLVDDPEFANDFFENSIYGHMPPDFENLLASFGFRLRLRHPGEAWLGVRLAFEEAHLEDHEGNEGDEGDDDDGEAQTGARIEGTLQVSSPLYAAGVGRGDLLIELGGVALIDEDAVHDLLDELEPGDELELRFEKRGDERTIQVTLAQNPELEVVTFEAAGEEMAGDVAARRRDWLAPHATPAAVEVVRYCPETGQPHPFRFRHCPIHGDKLQLNAKRKESDDSD